MRYLLLAAIRFYWLFWPRHQNRACLYRESCSHYVFRIAQLFGLIAGMRALSERFHACRPGYVFTTQDCIVGIRLKNGAFVPGDQLSEPVIAPILAEISLYEERLLFQDMSEKIKRDQNPS